MTDAQREATRGNCEEKGIHWVRSVVNDRSDGLQAQYMREWIDEYEVSERAALEARQYALAERATSAAETSSTAAEESAKTSGTSSRAAMFAAIVSFFAFVVAVAAYFKQ